MSHLHNEQMLSEVAATLMKKYNIGDINKLKTDLSPIIVNYDVKKVSNNNSETNIKNMIEFYIESKKLEGLSLRTLSGYQGDLNVFARYINKDIEHITTNDIRFYLSQFPNNKMSTIGKKLSTLKSFFGWLLTEEIIKKDPSVKVRLPKEEKRLPKSLSIEELEMLKENCSTIRRKAFIHTFYSTGCRVSEVQQMNVSKIDFKNRSTKVIGKGNKERTVYFSSKAIFYLEKYLASRNDNDDALFVTQRKPYRRMTIRAIQDEIKKCGKGAKYSHSLSPKLFRSTFAFLTLNNGADLATVQEILGHSDPATTNFYARATEERAREQHRKFLIQ